MMYAVKSFEIGPVECEKTLFKSAVETDCWDFIRNHLTCGDKKTRDKARFYVVMDSIRRCYDPSYDIYILKKAA